MRAVNFRGVEQRSQFSREVSQLSVSRAKGYASTFACRIYDVLDVRSRCPSAWRNALCGRNWTGWYVAQPLADASR